MIHALEQSRQELDSLLVACKSTLVKINNTSGIAHILAEDSDMAGYEDGTGVLARFQNVTDIVQLNDAYLLAEETSNCL